MKGAAPSVSGERGPETIAAGVRRRRVAFFAYWLLLFAATHKPGLQIRAPVERPDLVIHLAAFGGFAALFIGAAFFGAGLSTRNILLAGLCAAFYASADEASQLMPVFARHAAWDDAAANMAGIALAVAGAFAVRVLTRSRRRSTTAGS